MEGTVLLVRNWRSSRLEGPRQTGAEKRDERCTEGSSSCMSKRTGRKTTMVECSDTIDPLARLMPHVLYHGRREVFSTVLFTNDLSEVAIEPSDGRDCTCPGAIAFGNGAVKREV